MTRAQRGVQQHTKTMKHLFQSKRPRAFSLTPFSSSRRRAAWGRRSALVLAGAVLAGAEVEEDNKVLETIQVLP